MLIEKKITEQGALIALWKIDETAEELLALFNDTSQLEAHLSTIANEHRRREILSVRALLKQVTGEEKTICYHNSGKPCLSDASYEIGISHTKGYAVIILHPAQKVAIDIEAMSDRASRLKERFLSLKEREMCNKSNEQVVSLLCWSAKETLYKYLPVERADFIKHFQLLPFKLTDNCLMAKQTIVPTPEELKINFEVMPDYVLTYCL